MDILQLSGAIMDVEVIREFFDMTLIPGIVVGFAFGTVLHFIGFAVFRALALLNTK